MGEFKPPVCILAAGRGQRLGHLTDAMNKAMLPLDGKAIISHIIDRFSQAGSKEFIIAIGYKGQLLRDYLELAHPEKTFRFVEIENWSGPGSGPGHSMGCCRVYLQRPFYLTTADCLVQADVPTLEENWIGVSPTTSPQLFATVESKNGFVTGFKNKDAHGYGAAYIGLCGIKDWEIFWQNFDNYREECARYDKEVENVGAFYHFNNFPSLKAIELPWLDTGTIDNYTQVRTKLLSQPGFGLPKTTKEVTYRDNNKVIKFFSDTDKCVARYIRYKDIFNKISPKTTLKAPHLLAYDFIPGKSVYECDQFEIYKELLNFLQDNLWTQPLVGTGYADFREACRIFYYEKTHERINQFLETRPPSYALPSIIQKRQCPSISELLRRINWEHLYDGVQCNFFGDCNYSNVIYDGNYHLIDYRECFSDITIQTGDLYQDLAKLHSGMLLNWHLMSKQQFSFTYHKQTAAYGYQESIELNKARKWFEEVWVPRHGYDINKIKLLSALMMLSMCPLHEPLFSDLLFFFSIHYLTELLSE